MMTNIDFTPLFHSTVGFDRLFDRLESSLQAQGVGNWPPYDIIREGNDNYRVTLAVAGFSAEELTITYEPNLLVVKGARAEGSGEEYLHRGLTNGAFERRFELADHVEVMETKLENGLLTVWLKRELPEAMKPRRIAISAATQSGGDPKQIEASNRAA